MFSASTNPPTHTYAYMHKSSTKRQVHLECSRLVLGFQGQTKLALPSTASNREGILLTLQLLAFTFTFSFTTPFQLWQSICRSPQRPELRSWSGLQCSQKNTGWLPTQRTEPAAPVLSVWETSVIYIYVRSSYTRSRADTLGQYWSCTGTTRLWILCDQSRLYPPHPT